MKKLLFITLLFFSTSVSSFILSYEGDNELCLKGYRGDVLCLSNGENVTITDNSYIYADLNYKTHEPESMVHDSVTFLEIVVMSLLLGVVLISSTWAVMRYIL